MIHKDIVKAVMATIPNGQFFTVVFEKANGSIRRMVCQRGVKKHVLGTGTQTKRNPDLQGVYEQDKEAYRCFDTGRVFYIKASGMEMHTSGYKVEV